MVGSQLVSVRKQPAMQAHRPRRGGSALLPVPGVPDWVLDSVSARDPRRGDVDIWTSRNRVASLADPAETIALLKELEAADGGAIRQIRAENRLPGEQVLLTWLDE
jgi:hypothetical protein